MELNFYRMIRGIYLDFNINSHIILTVPFLEGVVFFFVPVYISCFHKKKKKSGVHECVDLCLGLQCDSIDWYVCSCANTILFLLL